MKRALLYKEPTWWVWLLLFLLLAVGCAGYSAGLIAAIVLSLGQTLFFWWRAAGLSAINVQIRLGYTLLLAIFFLPQLRWCFWLAAIGTGVLLLFGYCLMGRTLSLMPWNRTDPLSFDLVRRTFFSPPVVLRPELVSACGEG